MILISQDYISQGYYNVYYMTLTSRYMTFCLTVYDSVTCIQHQHIMSEYGFIKCEYINIIGNTVVSSHS